MAADPVRFHESNLWSTPIRDLGLTIEGTRLEPILAEFSEELRQIGISLELQQMEFPLWVERRTAGKFDIGAFGVSEAQTIPDHTLDFTVSLTDADGDAVSDSFQVTVDAVPFVI